jgi:hypothetical protein
MSLDRDAPVTRTVQPPSAGRVVALPRVGALFRNGLSSGAVCILDACGRET